MRDGPLLIKKMLDRNPIPVGTDYTKGEYSPELVKVINDMTHWNWWSRPTASQLKEIASKKVKELGITREDRK